MVIQSSVRHGLSLGIRLCVWVKSIVFLTPLDFQPLETCLYICKFYFLSGTFSKTDFFGIYSSMNSSTCVDVCKSHGNCDTEKFCHLPDTLVLSHCSQTHFSALVPGNH